MRSGFWGGVAAVGILGLIIGRLLMNTTRQTKKKNWLGIVDSARTGIEKQRVVKELNKIVANLVK